MDVEQRATAFQLISWSPAFTKVTKFNCAGRSTGRSYILQTLKVIEGEPRIGVFKIGLHVFIFVILCFLNSEWSVCLSY